MTGINLRMEILYRQGELQANRYLDKISGTAQATETMEGK
jgi:hypothetical protein